MLPQPPRERAPAPTAAGRWGTMRALCWRRNDAVTRYPAVPHRSGPLQRLARPVRRQPGRRARRGGAHRRRPLAGGRAGQQPRPAAGGCPGVLFGRQPGRRRRGAGDAVPGLGDPALRPVQPAPGHRQRPHPGAELAARRRHRRAGGAGEHPDAAHRAAAAHQRQQFHAAGGRNLRYGDHPRAAGGLRLPAARQRLRARRIRGARRHHGRLPDGFGAAVPGRAV